VRALLQRVSRASVVVADEEVGEVGVGLVVMVGVAREDSEKDIDYLAEKIVNLRIFPNGEGRFNRSALEIGAEFLVVSQFTLLADTRKGRRPSFTDAAPPDEAEALFEQFVDRLRRAGLRVETGRFQQHMLVNIHNDGPVTIFLDSRERLFPRR
jgi:D-tyrosyl-tRNA(Tyr) deacylase